MYLYLTKHGAIESAGAIDIQAEINGDIEPADYTASEEISFVWTPSASAFFQFEGKNFYTDFQAYWGEENGRAWIEVRTDDTEGILEEDERGDYHPIPLDRLQQLEKAAGGSWEFSTAIDRAMYSAAKAAESAAIEFLKECREEDKA